MIISLDTHTLVWFLDDPSRLSSEVIKLLGDERNELRISVIVLAEIKRLHEKGRIKIGVSDVVRVLDLARNTAIVDIDLAIIQLMPPSLEIHDAIIVATALRQQQLTGEKCPVVTCDKAITESGLVDVVW